MIAAYVFRDSDGRPLNESHRPFRIHINEAVLSMTVDEVRRLHEKLEYVMSLHDNDIDSIEAEGGN